MHYKMRDQIRFKIGKEEKNIQEKWIEIPEGIEHIQMMIEMPEEFQYMAFLFLEDPKKEIRFQKLLGYGQQNPGIGKSTKDTTIGGVPRQAGSPPVGNLKQSGSGSPTGYYLYQYSYRSGLVR